MLNDPVNGIDPLGFAKINRSNPDADCPSYGNWGGQRYSAGERVKDRINYDRYSKKKQKGDPVDDADRVYMNHDYCYIEAQGDCKKMTACDQALIDKLNDLLKKDPKKWDKPPTPGTEDDAILYMKLAKYYFHYALTKRRAEQIKRRVVDRINKWLNS